MTRPSDRLQDKCSVDGPYRPAPVECDRGEVTEPLEESPVAQYSVTDYPVSPLSVPRLPISAAGPAADETSVDLLKVWS